MKLRRLTITFITGIIISLTSCNGQSSTSKIVLRPTIQKFVDEIAKDNILKSEGVGEAGVRTKQWDRFEELRKTATDKELIELTNHENSVVRCYSFEALTSRKNVDIFPILLKHLYDTSKIKTFSGCIMSSQLAGDYFVNVVTPEDIDLNVYKLSAKQRSIVDSILLFDKTIRLENKYTLISGLKSNPKYYNRLREIAITEKNPIATLALARFKNQNDIEIIKSLFRNEDNEYYAAYSVREFSDNSFYPIIVNLFEKEWKKKLYDYPLWRILYQALAKYPSKETYELFDRTTKTKDSFRYQTLGKYLKIAITKYPNPIFEPLKEKIRLDEFNANEMKNESSYEK